MTIQQVIGVEGRVSACGRGWIPASRDIGLPGEAEAREREAFAARMGVEPAPHAETGSALPHTTFSPARRVRFLDALAGHGNVRAACALVGISAQTAYKARRRETRFAAAWDAALLLARDHAETELADRALNGVVEIVYYRGEAIGRRRKYDNRLLLALLGRLDKGAGNKRAEHAAARFDELLAVIGGLAPDAAMAEAAQVASDEIGLPASREDYRDWTIERVWSDAEEAVEDEGEEAYGVPRHLTPEEQDEVAEQVATALVEADAACDAWEARVHAAVDAIVEGRPEDAPASLPQDSVNCVNLSQPLSSLRAERSNPEPGAPDSGLPRGVAARNDGDGDEGWEEYEDPAETGGSAIEQGEFHAAAAGLGQADLLGGGLGEVDHAAVAEGTAIVDPDYHALAGAGAFDADATAEGESAMGGGEFIGIEAFAAGGALPVELGAVPAGHAARDLLPKDRGPRCYIF